MGVQPGLCRTWSETLKTGFLSIRLNILHRFPSNEYAEKITTATGETMGGFEASTTHSGESSKSERNDKRIVVDVHSALKARQGMDSHNVGLPH